jgi:hypothetical protein
MIFMELTAFLTTTPGTFLLISSFILFIFFVKKVFSIIIHAGLVAMASAAFPFVANYTGLAAMLGINITTSLDTVLFFVTLGLVVYFLYLIGKIIYSAMGFIDGGKKRVIKIEKKSDN